MFQDSTVILAIFAITIASLVYFQHTPSKVFGASAFVLYLGGYVSSEQLVQSFTNKGLLTLILLMSCSLALEKTKLLRMLANSIISNNYYLTLMRLCGFTALASSILNNTAIVATMLAPIKNNTKFPASRLLLPLSYAAILGGTLTLIGTSTNLIVNSLLIDQDIAPLNFFDFTPIGVCVVIACSLVIIFFARFLPENKGEVVQASDYFIDAKVLNHSGMIGKSIEDNGLRSLESLFLVEVLRANRLISPVSPYEIIESGDRLIFSGDISKVTLLSQFDGLETFADKNQLPLNNLSEVIVRPDSILVGKTLKRAGFRALFDAAVVGIRRDGNRVSGKLGDAILEVGDYLTLAVGPDFSSRRNIQKNFYLVSDVETAQLLSGNKEKLAVGGFLLSVGLAALGVVPLFKSLVIFLALLVFCGCLTTNEIIQRVPKQIWVVIGSAILLSQAMSSSGALNGLMGWVMAYQESFSPLIAVTIVYLITWLLTELLTNNAAAALMLPLGLSVANSLSIEPHILALTIAFGASASFISPYGYQTNLMVYSAGGYKLNNFLKIGLPVSAVYALSTLSMIYWLFL